jgi:hypothetical protein
VGDANLFCIVWCKTKCHVKTTNDNRGTQDCETKCQKRNTKRTAAGIPTWSPTVVLICRSTAYVWQSGRDAQFSADYGRTYPIIELMSIQSVRICVSRGSVVLSEHIHLHHLSNKDHCLAAADYIPRKAPFSSHAIPHCPWFKSAELQTRIVSSPRSCPAGSSCTHHLSLVPLSLTRGCSCPAPVSRVDGRVHR